MKYSAKWGAALGCKNVLITIYYFLIKMLTLWVAGEHVIHSISKEPLSSATSMRCWIKHFLNWDHGLTPSISLIVGSTVVQQLNISARWKIFTISSNCKFAIQLTSQLINIQTFFSRHLAKKSLNVFLQMVGNFNNFAHFNKSFTVLGMFQY